MAKVLSSQGKGTTSSGKFCGMILNSKENHLKLKLKNRSAFRENKTNAFLPLGLKETKLQLRLERGKDSTLRTKGKPPKSL